MVRRAEGDEEGIAFCYDLGGELRWKFADGSAHAATYVHSARSLVSLDLADGYRAGWPALIDALRMAKRETGLPFVFASLIDQIEAQTAPPRPAEPTGLGVRVVDREGRRWAPDGTARPRIWWPLSDVGLGPTTWDALLDYRGPVTIEGGESDA